MIDVILEQIKKDSTSKANTKLEFIARLTHYNDEMEVKQVDDETYSKMIESIKEFFVTYGDVQSLNGSCSTAERETHICLSYDQQAELLIQRSSIPHGFIYSNWLMQQFAVLPIKLRGGIKELFKCYVRH